MQLLVKAAGHDANFLLNVGPMPDGTIQAEHQERLREVGLWLHKNGESIYGTRGGPITPRSWGVTTQKGNRVFVHLLDWKDKTLALPKLQKPVKAVTALKDGKPLRYTVEADGLLIRLDPSALDPLDTILVIELGA